jgi:xylan 1,4-beta-xylosidase
MASVDAHHLYAMAWHYHDDDVPGPDAQVTIKLSGLGQAGGSARLTHYCIDAEHSNAYTTWQRLGAPLARDDAAYARLLQAAQLATLDGSTLRLSHGAGVLDPRLPRQGVSLLILDW